MENISTSEMLGHLRTSNRLFKSFEKAIEIAEVLAEHEGMVTRLKTEISALETERNDSDQQCEKLVASIAGLKVDIDRLRKQMETEGESAALKAKSVLDNAKAAADKIVSSANTDVEDTLGRIAKLRLDENVAKANTQTAILKLEAAQKKVDDFKANFASS